MKKVLVLSLVLLLGVAITGIAKTNFFDDIYIDDAMTVVGTATFGAVNIVGNFDVNGTTVSLDGSTSVLFLSAGYVGTQSADIRLGLDADDYMKLVTSDGTANLAISHPGNTGALITWTAGGWTLTGTFEIIGASTFDGITTSSTFTMTQGEILNNASDGVVTITGDDDTGIQFQIISKTHDTTGDASLVLAADAGDDGVDTWTITSEATGNDLSFINASTEVFNLTTAGNAQFDGTLTIDGLSNLNGGIAIDTSTFTVDGATGAVSIAHTTPPDIVLENTTAGADADSGKFYWRGEDHDTSTDLDMSIFLDVTSNVDYKLSFMDDGASTEVASIDQGGNLQIDGLADLDGGIAVDSTNFTVSGTDGTIVTAADIDVKGADITNTTVGGGLDLEATPYTANTATTFVEVIGTTAAHGTLTGTDIFFKVTPTIGIPTGTAVDTHLIDLSFTSPAWASGVTSNLRAIYIAPTIGAADAGTNQVNMIEIEDYTGDAQVNVTGIAIGTSDGLGVANAITIDEDWDLGIDTASPVTMADDSQLDLLIYNETTGSDQNSGWLTLRGYDHDLTTAVDMALMTTVTSTTDYQLSFLPTGHGTEVASVDQGGNIQLDGDLTVDGGGIIDTTTAGTLLLDAADAADGANKTYVQIAASPTAHSGSTPTSTLLDIAPTFVDSSVDTTINLVDMTFTLPDYGQAVTSVVRGLYFAPTIGDTGATGTNTLALIDVAAITTGDQHQDVYVLRVGAMTQENAETANAIDIGAGWDAGLTTTSPVFLVGAAADLDVEDTGTFDDIIIDGTSGVLDFTGATDGRIETSNAAAEIVLDAADQTDGNSKDYVQIEGSVPIHTGAATTRFLDINPTLGVPTFATTVNLIDMCWTMPTYESAVTSIVRGIYFDPDIGAPTDGTNTLVMIDIEAIDDGDDKQHIYGLRIGNLTNAAAFTENAIDIGTGWDLGFDCASAIDVQGTTNLDIVDIDGAVDFAAKIVLGGAWGASPIDLDGTDPDQAVQFHSDITTDVADGAYATTYETINITSSLTGDTSVFGDWSECYVTGDITLAKGNLAGSWGHLELIDGGGGNLTLNAVSDVYPNYAGGVVGTVIVPDTLVVGAHRSLAAVVASGAIASGYSVNADGDFAGVLIRADDQPFPVGLLIDDGDVTIDIQFSSDETLDNATDGDLKLIGDDDTGIDFQIISKTHNTTGDASLTLDADAGDDDDDTWILRSTANGNAFDIIQHATTELSISSAGDLTVTGDITVSGGDIIDGSGGGVAVTNKGTSIETLGGAQKTVITFTLTGAHDIDTADGGKSTGVQVYDFPEGYIQILGALIDCSVVTNAVYNADANDIYYISVGTVDGTQAADADLTGTEADIIPKTTHDTDVSGANTQLTNDWHAQDLTVETFDGTSGAIDLFVNVAVPDASATGATTHAITGTLTIFWINHGDY